MDAWEIEKIKADICDHYCKYPEKYPDSEYEQMLNDRCEGCPLGKLDELMEGE